MCSIRSSRFTSVSGYCWDVNHIKSIHALLDIWADTSLRYIIIRLETKSLLPFFFQIQALDWWPAEDADFGMPQIQQCTIAQLLADNHFSLVINLPFRNAGTRAASSFVTQGYRTRRMAVEYSVPLITDIKCTKLLIEVSFPPIFS